MPGIAQAVAAALLLAPASAEPGSAPLFLLARSKNANVVEYSVRVTPDGRLDAETPVDVHWLLRAEDGRRAELSLFERLLAFGVRVQLAAGREAGDLRIVALPTRPIQVRRGSQGYEADTAIAGAPARLASIYVTSQDGGGWPKVLSIELRGTRLADGAPAYERILP